MASNKIPFQRPTRLETLYQAEIQRLLDKYFDFPTYLTLGELNARLVEYGQAKGFFQALATRLATRMITMTAVQNARSWRAAASQGSNGARIYSMLRDNIRGGIEGRIDELIQQNATLITSLPQSIAGAISKHIQSQQMQGVRSSDIIKQIAPYAQHMKQYQIQRLARTEVAKADTAITQARAEDIGANWYVWRNSMDARVRRSHRKMEHVLVSWNEPPSPEALVGETSYGNYPAGGTFNCRCVALPIIRLDQITFPAVAYHNGRLQRVTMRQFALMAGIRQIAA